jgi:hypothetical protein
MYYEWVNSLHLPNAVKLFLSLKEISNIFIADGTKELSSLVQDLTRHHQVLNVEELLELIRSRSDYKKIQNHVETKECCIQ